MLVLFYVTEIAGNDAWACIWGCTCEWGICAAIWLASLGPSSAFSSSLLFRQAALGFKFRSASEKSFLFYKFSMISIVIK